MRRMNLKSLLVGILMCAGPAVAATPRTLRVDYFHTGNAKAEMFSLDRVVLEPLPWPGNPDQPLDGTNLGKYFFEVRDKASGKALYSRGFASVFGEWVTTDEAKTASRTFNESWRFPAPSAPVHIVLKKRDAKNGWTQIWAMDVDPRDPFIDRSKAPSAGPLVSLQKSGDPAKKVDFLILGDGYTAAQRPKCEADANRLMGILFSTEPFKTRRTDFNVWALCPASAESGISRPSTGVYRRNPVGTTYDAFGSERYILTYDNHAFRDLASNAPYEFVEILTNTDTYGGGGIFNLYSTVAANSLWAPYIFIHEFGHHFAGLADEYYTSDVAYGSPSEKVEPWEPNATAMRDPAKLKWKDLIQPGTPLPTPWDKAAFERYSRDVQKTRRQLRKDNRPESEMNTLFTAEREHEDRLLAAQKYAGKVGAFEGSNYEATGYYRPETNCIMFTRTETFCRVCQRGIERVVDLYTK